MASQVFYRKWRPQTLADVVGQEHVTRTLLNALSSGRVSHAYLFCGPRGTGKTSTGRILAKAVNCLSGGKGEPCNSCRICVAVTEGRALDVIEIDAASNRGIEDIRDLREKVAYAPNEASYKVYIIDEVHMLTRDAANALLKTLEEPPPHAIFVLATTEPHKVIPTILSRCQRFDFHRLSQADVISRLSYICREEGISVPPEGLRHIARSTTGSLRDAENLLQQLSTYYGTQIEVGQVQAILGITGDWRARELVKHVIGNDIAAGMKTIVSVNGDGLDLKQFNREAVDYLRSLLLIKSGAAGTVDVTAEDMLELKELAGRTSLDMVMRAVKLFGQLEFSLDNYSTLPLELALVDCILAESDSRPRVMASRNEAGPGGQVRQTGRTEPDASAAVPSPVAPAVSPEAALPQVGKTVEAGSASPSPVSPEPKAVSGTEIERLKLEWKKVLDESPAELKKTRAVALLRSGKPVAVTGDIVTLSFKFPIHKETIEKQENLQVTEKIISGYLGRPCRVRCVHEPEDNHLAEAAKKMGAQVISVEGK